MANGEAEGDDAAELAPFPLREGGGPRTCLAAKKANWLGCRSLPVGWMVRLRVVSLQVGKIWGRVEFMWVAV